MSSYKPSVIANAFLHKAKQESIPIRHMRLQKLIYFTYTWGIVLNGKSVLQEEPEVWEYGPVFESLFYQLKDYGTNPIDEFMLQMTDSGIREPRIPHFENQSVWGLINQVWDRYKGFSDLELSALAHAADSAWAVARENHHGWVRKEDVLVGHLNEQTRI